MVGAVQPTVKEAAAVEPPEVIVTAVGAARPIDATVALDAAETGDVPTVVQPVTLVVVNELAGATAK